LYIPNSVKLQKFEYKQPSYWKIHNIESGSSVEMKGFDVELQDVNNTERKDWGCTDIHTDFNDIQAQKGDGYDKLANDQFCIVSTNYDDTLKRYFLRDATGLLLGTRENNIELGFPYTMKYLYAPFPVNSVKINGNIETISSTRVEKTKQVKIEISDTDIDYTKNIRIFGAESAEIISETHKAYSNVMELTLKI